MTFDERVKMCDGVHEGTEIEAIIKKLTQTARMLYAFEDYDCQILLIIAERMCSDFLRNDVLSRKVGDWEYYRDCCSDEVFAHFTGGAKRIATEEEFYATAQRNAY